MLPEETKQFQEYVRRIRMDFETVFAEGCRFPVPGLDCTLEEIIDLGHLARLGDYIEHYHAGCLPPRPAFQPDSAIPLGTTGQPTLEGLLDYLEHHWLPQLLAPETRGIGLHFDRHSDEADEALSFTLGMHLTGDSMEPIDPRNPTGGLIEGLQREFGHDTPGRNPVDQPSQD